ncbi:MarR family winged helix-turn-helix transcriptional regulator [Acetanaerobacterium elongatum]|uniref:Transcriptional regulator, MarR family n=1 Tax=Acetanaerobacterium elongatum TaxID=258515 RepID=A0A1G9WLF5_9FIRM|nr:MarR family transcriptional regulator [Acetanaerobacterium elongatum]SDM85432.1 transcriptional regulator, MarR family [Acetanaerobacterium elongatum]
MENDKLQELHNLFLSLIPLFNKCKNYIEKNNAGPLCNKNQSMAVMIIGKAESITPTTLSKFINMEKGSLTTLIDSLEEKELVTRFNDPNDRRKVLLSLTTKGIEYMESIEEQSRNGLTLMVRDLEDDKIDQMYASLKTLVEILREISGSI